MKRILVPVDFSPASQNTAGYAALLAKFAGAELYLLHVHSATIEPNKHSVTGSGLQILPEELMIREIGILEEKCLIKANGIVKAGNMGYKGQQINKYSEHIDADLIVMGMKAARKGRVSESTSFKMIRRANIPVLIVPEGRTFTPFKNIILAADFNDISGDACLKPLFSIIELFDASLRVLYVNEEGVNIDPAETPGMLLLGHDLSKAAYLHSKIEHIDEGQGILEFVRDHPADLLVMFARQYIFLEQLFRPAHAHYINPGLKLPLLALKEGQD